MTVADWLALGTKKLEAAGIETARLDTLVLLENVTGHDRAWLLARPEAEISAGEARKLTNLLNRRAGHEPLAYVRGHTEFYGRDFLITPAVLEPRPESETMIDLFKDLMKSWPKGRKKVSVADVGTGSGALGITAALEAPNAQVELLDIDSGALKMAKINVDKFTLNLSCTDSDLLEQAVGSYDVLLCNLPYVPDSFQINQAAAREPRIAIFGGPDGLDLYRKLFNQLKMRPKKPLYILSEALPPQHQALSGIAAKNNYKLAKTKDFIQLFTTA